MTSERRAAAARANGTKSRGPVTAQGKANSARNSFRHGLRAKLLFNDGKFEPERQAILAGLTEQFKPKSETESQLVETIANAHWARIRLWRLETDLFTAEMRRLNCTVVEAFRSLVDNTCALDLLGSFESRCSRLYYRALARLYRIQDARPIDLPQIFINERTHQLTENKETADQAQRLADPVRHSFVDSPTEIPAKCAQAL